jgi:thiamine biosynthesis lipoprotein
MLQREIRAMNTDCLLILHPGRDGDAAADLARAAAKVNEYESRFSRFQSSSDLSQLNDDERERTQVSSELAALLARGLKYAQLTGGVFDPVVLAELQALGYDRSFEKIPAEVHGDSARSNHRFRWNDVKVDVRRNLVSRPYGALVDLGGLAKGAAADAALADLAHHAGALVDLGGDIRATGRPDDADCWYVSMDGGDGSALDYMQLRDGAIATSSVRKRRWVYNGATVHHVIDPRTGLPASSDALQCSVIADTAEHAEVAAKAGLILGVWHLHEENDLGRALGVRGVAWITTDNGYVSTPGWRADAFG